MSDTITPTAKEREHAKNYPADAAVDIARLAIKREPKYNRIALIGAAIEAHAVEALIGHVAALTAENERLTERLRLVDRIAAGLPSSRETTDG